MIKLFALLLLFSYNIEKQRVKIYIQEHKQVYQITDMGISIEHLKEGYAESHLSEKEIQKLKDAGFQVEILPEETYPKAGYHDYAGMVAKLDSIVNDYPSIATKFSIGTTQQGRNIWVLKISDNVDTDEDEPEVRFIGIIHGDEPVGCELLLFLADTLTKQYGSDPYLTSLVNNREIFLIPMYNADGRENSTRELADGEDPNRDFPVPDGSPHGSVSGISLETQELMDWLDTMNIVLSVTYHGGARVVNYEWDYTDEIPPYYELIRRISIGYAIRNDSMFLDPTVFGADSGTIRGYEWYQVLGSLQDWAYHQTGCIDLTIELNPTKWPSSSELPELWRQNRDAMLWFIEQSGYGVWGRVTDANTGNPVPCTYYVLPETTKVFKNDSIVGDFHRPLLTGDYTFVFMADGYNTRTIPGVHVRYDSTTYLDVQMYPLVPVNISGTVTDSAGLPIDSARVEIIGIAATYTDQNGGYNIGANAGELYFVVSKTGYATLYDTIVVQRDTTIDFVLGTLNQYDFPTTDTIDIPDNDPNGIYDSLFVDGHLNIEDIEVYVNITHTYISDLIVRLISPSGTGVYLHNETGGSNENIVGWYDSELPVDGPGTLADFQGEDAYGWWRLFVSDNASWDTGTLNGWTLRIYTPDNYTGFSKPDIIGGIDLDRTVSPNVALLLVPEKGHYNVKVVDVAGRSMKILNNALLSTGEHTVNLDNIRVPGVYYLVVEGCGRMFKKRFVVVR